MDTRTVKSINEPETISAVRITGGIRIAIYTIAVCMIFMIVFFARSLFLPIALSVIFTLTLSPLVRFARRRNIPTGLSSVAVTSTLLIGMIVAIYSLSQPVAGWIDDAPTIGNRLEERLRSLREPVEAVQRAEKEVEEITETAEPGVQKVVVKQPGLLTRAAGNLAAIVATVVVTFGLTTFLLAYSDVFYEKLMRILPRLSDKKLALGIIYDIEKDVSRYLLTITAINICLGTSIGVAMWLLGMPTPYLWGMAATLLNFLPFLGSIVGVLTVAVIALISIDSFAVALAVPAIYLMMTAIEGHFITPTILGRRLELNPVVILISVALWGFLWGVIGVLIAVPILIIVKVVSDRIERAAPFAEFLSGSRSSGPSKGDKVESPGRA